VTELVASAVSFSYHDHRVLELIDLALSPGSMTLLAGRNGAGKSTLLSLFAGLRRPSAGVVRVDDRDIGALPVGERARLVTLIPQDSDASFEYTGEEVVMMGRHPHISRFGVPGLEDHAAVDDALAATDARRFATRSVRTLSGGELRRIHIARALATRASILLADEPTANLDLEHAVAVLRLLRELADAGHTVLLSSHDLNLLAPRCDRVALLHDARVHSEGPPESVLCEATVAEVFGVRSAAPTGYFPRDFAALPPPAVVFDRS
jgi:iron complex transport system ATP-binding protein